MKISALILSMLASGLFVNAQKKTAEEFHVRKFTENVFYITEVMFHDVVNPPAAARFYSYSMLTANHVVSEKKGSNYLEAAVKSYPRKAQIMNRNINLYFATTYAMLETAKNIIPSGYSLEEKQDLLLQDYLKSGVNRTLLDSSIAYAKAVSKSFIQLSKTDGYLKLSTRTRYQPSGSDSTWYPTPPEYMAAIEPYWNTIRPFFLDSCSQFIPARPAKFSRDPASDFFKLTKEVHEVSKTLTAEQKLIATYWDCNPFANFYSGHVNVAIKKISPGGHWMNITGIACKKAKVGFTKSVFVHTLVAMGLHDGFISCWDEKYRSHRLRPKSAINKLIDDQWNPLIETPPFPEYSSGHSVISTASATILTYLLGDDFEFEDTTEVMFGFAPRKFKSFKEASKEAAISRLYGGIHYRDGIENGQKQGEEIGKFIISKISTSAKLSVK
jgi:hypothetical protein